MESFQTIAQVDNQFPKQFSCQRELKILIKANNQLYADLPVFIFEQTVPNHGDTPRGNRCVYHNN